MGKENNLGNDSKQTAAVEKSQINDKQTNKRSLWRKALAVVVILLGVLVGFWFGFIISFSACFKSACSPLEETASLTIPIATLFLTIPFAKRLNQNERGALKKIILSSIAIFLVGLAALWVISY